MQFEYPIFKLQRYPPPVPAWRFGIMGLGGLRQVRSLLPYLGKPHPEEVLESHSGRGGTSCVEAIAHVDVGAGGIDGRFTQDGQSKRCPSRRGGAGELADAANGQSAAQ
jgi:hypothetical protein